MAVGRQSPRVLPDWMALGLAIAGVLSVVFAAVFVAGERLFPTRPVRPSSKRSGERKRRGEIRAYLDAIGERYAEDHPVAGETPAFYLPERDVVITFDAQAYFRIEAAGTYAVLVEHEMPGAHLGTRLPFETPSVGPEPADGRDSRDGHAGWGAGAGRHGTDPRSRWASGGGGARSRASAAGDPGADPGMAPEDAFSVLDVDADSGPEAVRSAYRAKVKEVHPDHGGDVEEFQRVQEAYAAARRAA